MVDGNTKFGDHSFKLPQTERIGHISANARHDDFNRMVRPEEYATPCLVQQLFFDQFASVEPAVMHSTAGMPNTPIGIVDDRGFFVVAKEAVTVTNPCVKTRR